MNPDRIKQLMTVSDKEFLKLKEELGNVCKCCNYNPLCICGDCECCK